MDTRLMVKREEDNLKTMRLIIWKQIYDEDHRAANHILGSDIAEAG